MEKIKIIEDLGPEIPFPPHQRTPEEIKVSFDKKRKNKEPLDKEEEAYYLQKIEEEREEDRKDISDLYGPRY